MTIIYTQIVIMNADMLLVYISNIVWMQFQNV